jgi:signal transduction histidine kinase
MGQDTTTHETRTPSNAAMAWIERTLSSPWRLGVLALLLATLLSWLSADQIHRWAVARRRDDEEIDFAQFFAPEFVHYLTWAAVAPLLLWFVVWTWRRLHPLLFAGVQLATCFAVAWSMGWVEFHANEALREMRDGRTRRAADERPGMREAPPDSSAGTADGAPAPRDGGLRERLEERIDERFGEGRDGRGERPPPPVGEWLRRRLGPENAVDNAERRLPRELLLYLFSLGIAGSAFAFLEQRRAERARLASELSAANLRSELANTQLRSLRAQLQPHFLFNALHGIGGLVREGRADEALGTLSDLGGLLRRTLDADRVESWSLATELALVDEYLSIEGVRLGERLRVVRNVDPACARVPLPPLLLLPLVENAIRHGVSVSTKGGTLTLGAQRAADLLRITIEDDGPGFPAEVLAHRRHPARGEVHVGLANTIERLERLLPGRHRVELSNKVTGGARVVLELPIEGVAAAANGTT